MDMWKNIEYKICLVNYFKSTREDQTNIEMCTKIFEEIIMFDNNKEGGYNTSCIISTEFAMGSHKYLNLNMIGNPSSIILKGTQHFDQKPTPQQCGEIMKL